MHRPSPQRSVRKPPSVIVGHRLDPSTTNYTCVKSSRFDDLILPSRASSSPLIMHVQFLSSLSTSCVGRGLAASIADILDAHFREHTANPMPTGIVADWRVAAHVSPYFARYSRRAISPSSESKRCEHFWCGESAGEDDHSIWRPMDFVPLP